MRTSFGLKYSFNVAEIEKIKWNIRERGSIHTEKIVIYCPGGKKLTVESIMLGFDNFSAYISANVGSDKIRILLDI